MPPSDATESRTAPRRRTQQERRETTCRALLDATVDCLVEVGYARTTTALVCERAGLSRGAHLHHFGTRAALVSAGVAHLGERIISAMDADLAALAADAPDRTGQALDVLWRSFSSELFSTALDLWATGRTDRELLEELEPVEHEFGRMIARRRAQIFPDQVDRPDFEELIDFVLSTVRGLALLRVVQPSRDTSEERWIYARERLLEVLAGLHRAPSRSTRG